MLNQVGDANLDLQFLDLQFSTSFTSYATCSVLMKLNIAILRTFFITQKKKFSSDVAAGKVKHPGEIIPVTPTIAPSGFWYLGSSIFILAKSSSI